MSAMARGECDEETPILESKNIVRMGVTSYNDDDITVNNTTDNEEKETTASSLKSIIIDLLRSIPACIMLSALNLMLAVPFGSVYFSPVIPLDPITRVTLGIRMSLLSLSIGQIVFAGCSNFESTAPWQLGELSAFYHAFGEKAAAAAGDDEDAILPTTLYLFSLSTLTIGLLFWLLGRYGFGKITSFFPMHVVLGLVAGVGVWFILLSVSVSIDPSSGPDFPIFTGQFAITLLFTVGLRVLQLIIPKERFMLLDPIYFLSIPLMFYLILFVFGIDADNAVDAGYFFAEPGDQEVSVTYEATSSALQEAIEIWKLFDFTKVYWSVAVEAAPQILISAIMGIFLVAPYIPMLCFVTKMDNFDVDKEFRSHGYANLLSSIMSPGGLSLGFAYSCTKMYRNAGGRGRWSSVFVSLCGLVSFVYGPALVKIIPRCMAGALLLDMGINLLLEGVVDKEKRLSGREHRCIWIIIAVMNIMDMAAALVAGLFMALLIHTLETFTNVDPVRIACDGTDLPSSRLYSAAALKVLEDSKLGRSRIAIFQLQGRLFYANMAKVEGRVFDFLEAKRAKGEEVLVAILDFTLVLGIDCTAATYLETLQERMQKQYDVSVIVMVSGPLNISGVVSSAASRRRSSLISNTEATPSEAFKDSAQLATSSSQRTVLSNGHRRVSVKPPITSSTRKRTSVTVRGPINLLEAKFTIQGTTYESLDGALVACEEALISLSDRRVSAPRMVVSGKKYDETDEVSMLLSEILDHPDNKVLSAIVKMFQRSEYVDGSVLWQTGDRPRSAVFLFSGLLAFRDDDEEGRNHVLIERGAFVGLRSLVLNEMHRSTIRCEGCCVCYSLSKLSYDQLVREHPEAARVLAVHLARDLSTRLHHVSNKVYLNNSSLLLA